MRELLPIIVDDSSLTAGEIIGVLQLVISPLTDESGRLNHRGPEAVVAVELLERVLSLGRRCEGDRMAGPILERGRRSLENPR
jgi:hypothetical protein